jgi:hypothetical protein
LLFFLFEKLAELAWPEHKEVEQMLMWMRNANNPEASTTLSGPPELPQLAPFGGWLPVVDGAINSINGRCSNRRRRPASVLAL